MKDKERAENAEPSPLEAPLSATGVRGLFGSDTVGPVGKLIDGKIEPRPARKIQA